MSDTKQKFIRQSVGFTEADMSLILRLKHTAEAKANRPLTVVDVLRDALACLAKETGLN